MQRSFLVFIPILILVWFPIHGFSQSGTWGLQSTSSPPVARALHAMAYDEAHNQLVVFGGIKGEDQYLGDTWTLEGSTWQQRNTPAALTARAGHAMAYDAARGQVVLFGGINLAQGAIYGDTWIWNGSQWTQKTMSAAPPARAWTAMVYDTARNEVVLFGGFDGYGGCYNDTWTWNGSNWSQKPSASRPVGRGGHAMAFDSARSQAVIFGGSDDYIHDDTWIWDGTNWQQKQGAGPSERFWGAMTFDASSGETILFGGGSDSVDAFGDTWAWNGTSWSAKHPSVSPSLRTGAAMVYDSARKHPVLFGGGVADQDVMSNQTWIWNAGAVPLPSPTISSVSPTSGLPAGFIAGFQVNGSNFGSDSTISFSGSGISVNSYTSRTASRIVANISIAGGAALGMRDVTVRNTDGKTATLAGGFTVGWEAVVLPAGGAASSSTHGSQGSAAAGYAVVKVNSGDAPYGVAVFSYQSGGIIVSEAGVPASPPTTSARVFIDFRTNVIAVPGRSDSGAIDINTGIAIVNYGSSTANVTYALRNAAGSVLTTGNGTVDAGNYFACFIDQLKNTAAPNFNFPPDFASTTQFGSLEITSSQPLSVLALRGTLNQRNEFLITTTPVADLAHPAGTGPIYFPQFVDGGGYTTSLVLLNTSGVTETGRFEILDRDGEPFVVNQVGGTADSSFPYTIQPGGVFRFQTDGFPSGANAGWVRLIPGGGTNTPIGSGVFGYNPGSILISESGVPSAVSTTHARIYVDLSESRNTGLALANLANADTSISMHAFQSDGSTGIGSGKGLDLPANGYAAAFANEFVDGLPAGFTGVLDIRSTTPFAALTLRSLMNARDDFLMTTFPVADMNAAAPSPIVFPQVADGGGYMTQFILISGGQASKATIDLYDENGDLSDFGN